MSAAGAATLPDAAAADAGASAAATGLWAHVSPFNPALAIIAGLALGLSLAFAFASLPIMRRPTLEDRVAPYLRDQPRVARLYSAPAGPRTGLRGMSADVLARTGAWLAARMTTDAALLRRLDLLGPATTVEHFRTRQVLCVLAGLSAGALLSVASALLRGFDPFALTALVVLGGVLGHILNDWWLSREVRARERRIMAEFPTVAELLALSVTAGEGTIDALERVCRSTTGELSEELRRALAEVRTGTPLVEALDAMGQRTQNPSIIRFVDGIAVAASRGTPLAEVLRAQAADVREHGRRTLMELSGRKEVGMLVPVVVCVLPVTVLFAVYPTLAVLDLGP
ncbi:type II secretion system F family protein [Brevibacterium album]|uniref:type II secretion system F family protein n=1 Tax=Brevibacterium album TaxID=417948 RepID=UPI0004018A3D|nr:type II secretion system F family protein [Brevibacterium album]